jgi:Beta-lactamase
MAVAGSSHCDPSNSPADFSPPPAGGEALALPLRRVLTGEDGGPGLALRAGHSYEELLVTRICGPLGLDDTRITLTAGMRQRLVPGHDFDLHKVPSWDVPAFAGAGALRSTANDLFRFLDACQGRRRTSLAPAVATLLNVRRQTDRADLC